jgi:hypothetical protein
MTICIGRPLIEKLASEGAWSSQDGESVVAASDLFGHDPYAEIERLRAQARSAFRAGFMQWTGPTSPAEAELERQQEQAAWELWSKQHSHEQTEDGTA